ncbi:hypothetical protein [Kordia sp.]|uniref:hypothetical protein n=1 Tax=Kordia sp. TaxID=1965332 RepID=UPI0025B96F1E|nr:hypothetical protein [Kordia sp.]MCH2195087.1 hypothetical protein [Kordia sp.]
MHYKFINTLLVLIFSAFIVSDGDLKIGDEISISNKKYVLEQCSDCFGKPTEYKKGLSQFQSVNKKEYAKHDWEITKTKLYVTAGKSIKSVAFGLIGKTPFGSIAKDGLEPWVDFAIDEAGNYKQSSLRSKLHASMSKNIDLYLQKAQLENGEGNITYAQVAGGFKEFINNGGIRNEDYIVLGKKVDDFLLEYVKNNEIKIKKSIEEFQQKISDARQEGEAQVEALKNSLNNKIEASANELKSNINAVNKLALENMKATQEIGESLKKFETEVAEKFDIVNKDIGEMQQEIKSNTARIKTNEAYIKNNAQNIEEVQKRTHENRQLITQNAYKIDVISGVLYENANTDGKLKLLKVTKFHDDPVKNKEIIETERSRLNNIQSVEKIQRGMSYAKEMTTLAVHLGLSPKDAENINKAIEISDVILQGTMAYFTSNPLQGLQAVNGALGILSGKSGQADPQFEAIMGKLNEISNQLVEIDKKIVALDEKIVKLYNLNIELHKETINRFNQLDYKLDILSDQVDYIIQIITSSCEQVIDAKDYELLWNGINNATSIQDLRDQHDFFPILKKVLLCIESNLEISNVDARTFLHFNKVDLNNKWESQILSPLLTLLKNHYNSEERREIFADAIGFSPLKTNTFSNVYSEVRQKKNTNSIDNITSVTVKDMNRLLHPKSVVQLNYYLNLLEPYFYYGNHSKNYYPFENERIQNFPAAYYKARNQVLEIWYRTLLKDCQIAIAQQNMLSGAPLISKFHNEISNPNVTPESEMIYRLLNSENLYLQTNVATNILHTELAGNSVLLKKLQSSFLSSYADATATIQSLNEFINGTYYKLAVVGSEEKGFSTMLKITTKNIPGYENLPTEIYLPIQTIDIIMENKMMYPKVLDELHTTKTKVIEKIIEYDIMEKASKEEYNELKTLLNTQIL